MIVDYSVRGAGDLVKDKDGISAAAVFYEMAAVLHREDNISVTQVFIPCPVESCLIPAEQA